tara:strand:+ start:20 stop:460 length:441 start_codon:yes stop_codon:yes gene_type:complete
VVHFDRIFQLNKEKVDLKKGQNITIKYPSKSKKDDMKLFDGVEVDENIKWVESPIVENPKWVEVIEDAVVEQEIFTMVEKMPDYSGGQQELFRYLEKNVRYPSVAKENGISGTVFINFIVNAEGMISDIKVLRGIPIFRCRSCESG